MTSFDESGVECQIDTKKEESALDILKVSF